MSTSTSRRIVRWLPVTLGGILGVATLGLLALQVSRFQLSQPGTSAEYWEYLCGVQLPGFSGHPPYSRSGGVGPIVDGRAYYFAQFHHRQVLYDVPVDEILRDVPLVEEHLERPRLPAPADCEGDDSPCELYGFAEPRRSRCAQISAARGSIGASAAALEAFRLRVVQGADSRRSRHDVDRALRERLARGRRVWLTVAFEAIYIAAWLAFMAGARPLRVGWRWRVGLGPFVLFLPYFLGYAPMTFTFGPSGGFAYPMYLTLAAIPMQIVPCSPLDVVVWPWLPQVLRGLSQVPGSPLAASRWACVGPVSSLALGAALAGILSVIARSFERFARRRRSAVG